MLKVWSFTEMTLGRRRPSVCSFSRTAEMFYTTPYSPDLAPSDYFLFALHKFAKGEKFKSLGECKQKLEQYLVISYIPSMGGIVKLPKSW
ncbi:hypothetical protein AVEN_244330-1 [Araneus ventricosus]|uniref:Histone-lysine N-methyltransferase SETMAR n=1 Tax=Araneus ventricosus TaxID=182803 RepID=A0A4Y2SKK6_ARAVE|nr:hypothetical protein AVEN_129329-1 [Araneus ventricosus]GBN88676.1 hypothetical protein AVEN_189085-1 [Araneus ventricosus]GBN88693.1 hypothetical protein AVEN_34017-1 [Araneus ventricosus]GBN88774.1 hypothetical protein AVEN_244330-1 [Araneus ventricosus]